MKLSHFHRFSWAALILAAFPALALAASIAKPALACDPTKMSCTPDAQPKPCPSLSCLSNSATQVQFEKVNNCKFSASECGSFNKVTQCCGKDPRTGKPRVVDKVMGQEGVISPGLDSFTWTNYTIACPNKKQNNAPPNSLWKECELYKKQTPEDPYVIEEIRSNGTKRSHCIDGCSTPPTAVAAAVALGVFLKFNRNNPTGYSEESSFLNACATHDVCYQTCNNNDQQYCDTELKNNSISACQKIPAGHITLVMKRIPGILAPIPTPTNTRKACENAAEKMYNILQDLNFGQPAFNLRRQQYCQCC